MMGAPGMVPPAPVNERLLVMVINSAAFDRAWAEYEQEIINEFGTVSAHGLMTLHAKLQAARDFHEHLVRRFYDEQS